MPRKPKFDPQGVELEWLLANYSTRTNKELAASLHVCVGTLKKFATAHRLRKDPAFLKKMYQTNMLRIRINAGAAHLKPYQFKPGNQIGLKAKTPQNIQAVLQLIETDLYSIKEIAQRVGISYTVTCEILRMHNIHRPRRTAKYYLRKRIKQQLENDRSNQNPYSW